MTREEWESISYMTFGEWWDQPQSPERLMAWHGMLEPFTAGEVQQALGRLLRKSPTFAPKLGQLLRELEPKTRSFDEIWPQVSKLLGSLSPSYHGERRALTEVRDRLGEDVAAWVAMVGATRLSLIELDDNGFELGRLKKSYDEMINDRQATARNAERAAAQIDGRDVKELGA